MKLIPFPSIEQVKESCVLGHTPATPSWSAALGEAVKLLMEDTLSNTAHIKTTKPAKNLKENMVDFEATQLYCMILSEYDRTVTVIAIYVYSS